MTDAMSLADGKETNDDNIDPKPAISRRNTMSTLQSVDQRKQIGYAPVNGLNMYYEVTGKGVIYIPAAFAFAGITEFPELAKRWRVVQVDLQGHGRTADIDRPLSFEQHAKDVVALMRRALGRPSFPWAPPWRRRRYNSRRSRASSRWRSAR
jgi:hypothetical protein